MNGFSSFLLSEDNLTSVLSTALRHGGQYADIFVEDTSVQSMELQDGLVSQAQRSLLHGAGVRVINGEQTGYAYTMDLDLPSLLHAAEFAGSIVQSSSHFVQVPSPLKGFRGMDVTEETELEVLAMRSLLMDIERKTHECDPRIICVKAILSQRFQHVWFVNSLGESCVDCRPRTTFSLNVVMEQDGKTQMGHASEMLQMGASFITEDRICRIINQAVHNASFLFDAVQPSGGEMTVVMASGGSGILLHEAIGHAFEADFIRKGTSIFTDKLGKEICSKDITIVDDGTQPYDVGFLHYDDEGIPGQRTVLVHEGRLESYIHDRISARYFGVRPTGNGRRDSFRSVPQPRMRSTYMLSGQASEEDIIRSVKYGIYAQNFTNGQVQIGAGDFTFYMKQGYLIENGRLTRPVRDVNIIGNGPRALQDIHMIGNNLCINHSASMCGKGGQSVPVSQGLPTVRIDKLIVG